MIARKAAAWLLVFSLAAPSPAFAASVRAGEAVPAVVPVALPEVLAVSPDPLWSTPSFKEQQKLVAGLPALEAAARLRSLATHDPKLTLQGAAARETLRLLVAPGALEQASPKLRESLGEPGLAALEKAAESLRGADKPAVAALAGFVAETPRGTPSRRLSALFDGGKGEAVDEDEDAAYAADDDDDDYADDDDDRDDDAELADDDAQEAAAPLQGQPPDPVKAAVLRDGTQALIRLRLDARNDSINILNEHLGGDVGDGRLHRDVRRVLDRLLRAAGMPREAAEVYIGSSFLPNAFTTQLPSEAEFLENNAGIAKAFRVSHVFISMGLLRSLESEDQLAFVLAHELNHNWKNHLKDFTGGLDSLMRGHFHELEADAEGLKLAAAAGYSPQGAIDSLYALDREYDRLEKEYTLLKRDDGEVAQALQRLRDEHPHADIRRANMLDRMNEALELYKPAPVPSAPLWMRLRRAEARPTHIDRFRARLEKAVRGRTVDGSLHALEGFIEKERAGELGLDYEKYAIIEEVYRRLLGRPESEKGLRPIEVSIERGAEDPFPSHRLKADLISRQLELLQERLRGKAAEAAPEPEADARRAKVLAAVEGIEDAAGLARAARGLARLAEDEELDIRKGADRALVQAGLTRLYRAAAALDTEDGELESGLAARLPAAWKPLAGQAARSESFQRRLRSLFKGGRRKLSWKRLAAAARGETDADLVDAGLKALLAQVSDRRSLKAAYAFLADRPAELSITLRLWRAAAKVLAARLKRPATSAEVAAELSASLPPVWADLIKKVQGTQGEAAAAEGVAKRLGRHGTLLDFLKGSSVLGREARLAGTWRLLGTIETRRELDAAYTALSRDAEGLGLTVKQLVLASEEGQAHELIHGTTSRLWRAARRVMSAELGRRALPEEIIDELREKLSPAWLTTYLSGFNVEIVESAFGPASSRSSRFRPSALAARLEGRSESPEEKESFKDENFAGLAEWNHRHYQAPEVTNVNGKMVARYERYHLEGVSAPSPEDQLDIYLWWAGQAELYPAFNRVLRREGKMEAYVQAALRRVAKELRQRMRGVATLDERREELEWYEDRVTALLESVLFDLRDLGQIRRTVEAAWGEIELLFKAKELNEEFAAANRSRLADEFFSKLGTALRQAVVATDLRGERPDMAEVRKTAALVARVDRTLRPFSGTEIVRGHARALGLASPSESAYMKAYQEALPSTVEGGSRFREWVVGPHMRLARPLVRILDFLYKVFRPRLASLRYRFFPPTLPGVPWEHVRSLETADFAHFMALIGDAATEPQVKLMAAALLDRLDQENDTGTDRLGRDIKMRAASALGRWLLEDSVSAAKKPEEVRRLGAAMIKLSDRHPGFLQPDFEVSGSRSNAFRTGAEFIKRNEPYRSLAKGEHPFRGVGTRWPLELMKRLDRAKAWPEKLADRLDLLDFFNGTGEFSDAIDERIIDQARAEPAAFRAWVKRDRKRLARLESAPRGEYEDDPSLIETPYGEIPVPKAQPLKLVRNATLRVRLFDLLDESKMGEKPPRRSLREWWSAMRRLLRAYRQARRYFSDAFLRGLDSESAVEDKILDVLEEADRVAAERAEEAAKRWEKGQFTEKERTWLEDEHELEDPAREWPMQLPHEKEDIVREYKDSIKAEALSAMFELYQAFAGLGDPVLGLILDNYPEPTRSRDELLERLIKARRLNPGRLVQLEGNKSYRQPNPVRMMEKQFLDQAVIQLKKFSPEEKVDILLHLAKVERLSPERLSLFNARILSGDRKRMSREYAGMRSIAQMENYISLLHPRDRSLLMRSLFYGKHSLHEDPAQVRRLYERLVIEGRDLPPFVQRVFRAYFEILTDDERAKLLSDLAGLEDVGPGLKGPQIVRVALKGRDVMGAKIAQVLATHRGLIGEDYGRELEQFKDRAQDLEKMRGFDLANERLARLGRAAGLDAPPAKKAPGLWVRLRDALERLAGRLFGWSPRREEAAAAELTLAQLDAISREALPEDHEESSVGEAARRRFVRQVAFLLKEQKRRVRWIEAIGPELGAGSIKLVYKIFLDDGRVWVVKVRAPGASYGTRRGFEIGEALIAKIEKMEGLDVPGARQLLDEVKSLVLAEMDFRDEAAKERGVLARAEARPWFARLASPQPYVPKPHPLYVGEDLMVEEFVPTVRFQDLPRSSLFGPSQSKISRLAANEGMFTLVYDEWLEPDPHTGNRHARAGGLNRLWTRLVVMDLGQGVVEPVDRLKPLMRAGLALEAGDDETAAQALFSIVSVPPKKTPEQVLAAVRAGLAKDPKGGLIERIVEALIEGEKLGALVLPQYASLQKAFLIYTGYASWLPKNYLFRSLERAAMARLWRDRPIPRWKLVWLGIRRTVLGRKAVRGEVEALIDGLK